MVGRSLAALAWSFVGTLLACDRFTSSADEPADDPASAATPIAEAPPTDATPTPAPTEPPPRGFAIVKGGAELFSKPDASGSIGTLPPHRIPTPSDPAVVPPPAGGSVVAVVGGQGEFVAVETLVDGSLHCASGIGAWSDLRVGLFVRKSDLLPVTTRKVEHAFTDGTRVVVPAGVVVGDTTGAGERIVDGGGLALELPLPVDAIGTFYDPSPRPVETEPAAFAKGTMTYGQGRVLATNALTSAEHGAQVYERKDADPGRALVRVASRCAGVTALVDASAVVDEETAELAARTAMAFALGGESAGMIGLLGAVKETTYEIRAGASLSWPDGRIAGLAERPITSRKPPRVDGERSCLVVPFVYGSDTGPELCVATGEVKTNEVPGSSKEGELGGLLGAEIGEGYGGLGLTAEGGDGLYGSTLGAPGHGPGLGTLGHGPGTGKKKSVKPGSAKVHGSLDKDIIRRVVKSHVGAVKACYEKRLLDVPTLAGKVNVSFIIGVDGSVTSAKVKDSTTGDSALDACVLKQVKAWTFPKPVGGGVVAVTYPFVFTSAE